MAKRGKGGDKRSAVSGPGDQRDWKDSIHQSLLGCMGFSRRFRKTWDGAVSLFDYRNVGSALSRALDNGDKAGAVSKADKPDTGYAVWVFVMSSLICFLTLASPLVVSAYLVNTQSDLIQEVTNTVQPRIGPAELASPLLLLFIVYVPLGIALSVCLEWAAFRFLRLLGGKGTLVQQFSLSSMVALASGLLSGLNLFSPLPCLDFIVIWAVVIASAYLFLVVVSKAYAMVHGIDRWKGLVAALFVALARAAVMYYAVVYLSSLLGVSAQIRL